MKKSTSKAIGIGLAGISVLSPIMDTGMSVLAVTNVGVKEGKTFEWVEKNGISSKIELVNKSEGNFWFYDDLSKTIYAKGGTNVSISYKKEGLETPIKSIEVVNNEDVIASAIGKNNIKVLLNKIPNGGNVKIVYTLDNETKDKVEVPFYDYFKGVASGVNAHKVDNVSPKLSLEKKDTSGGTVYKDQFKGVLKYTLESEKFDKLLPNVWGTNGYKVKLLINGEDYSDSKSVGIHFDDVTGKINISLDFDTLYKTLDGKCNIELSVYDNVGNVSKYNDTINLDYSAPSIKGSISNVKWLDKENNVVYFNEEDSVKVNYEVSDTGSGVKNVALIKNSSVINPRAKSTGSLVIDSEGTYEIKVEDNLGNSKIYPLSQIVEGVADTVKFDKSKPSVDVQAEGLANKDWVKNSSSIKIDVKDDIGIKSIDYSINGTKQNIDLKGNPKSHSITIDPSKLDENTTRLNVNLTVTDVLGNKVRKSKSYKVDISFPKLDNAEVVGDITIIDGKACSKEPLIVRGDTRDIGSGLASIDIFKDGILVSNALPYTISEDGVYSIKLTDKVGNVTEISLEDIVGKKFSGVVIDGNPPKVDAKVDGADVIDGWYKDKATLVIKSEDDKNIKTVKYSINGKESIVDVNKKDFNLELKLEDYVNDKGLVDVDVTVIDDLGNEGKFSKVIRVDKVAPKIVNANLEGNIFMIGNIAFLKGSAILSADIVDNESSVAKVEILNKGEVVGTSLPFKIEKGGIYSIRVTDEVGHVVTKSLKDLLSKDIEDIVIDNDAPVLTTNINGDSVIDDWYKDKANLTIKADDTSSIEKVEYTINDKKFSEKVGKPSHQVSLDLEKYVDAKGKINVSYKAIDSLGSESSFNKVISLDTKNPVLENGKIDGDMSIEDGIGYVKDKVILKADYSDLESGVSKVEVLKGSEVVGNSLPYAIKDSGTYSVRITDGVGHVVTKSLKDLTGLKIDSILVDREKPSITEVNGFTPDLEKDGVNWYKSMPNMKVSIKDDNLESVSIKVNNKEVIKDISQDGNYTIPLEKKEGSFKIDIKAIDKAGNITNSSYFFKVDISKPSIDSGVLKGDYVDRGYGLYFNEMPTITLKGTDTGIGIKEYVLLDKGFKEVGRSDKGVFTLGTGEYFVKTVDFFDKASKPVSLKKLCNLESNRIVIDNESPVILASRPDGDINGWFNKNVVYDVQLSDNIGIHKATVSINGKVVKNFEAKSDATNIAFMVDTAEVYKKDGKYVIEVVAEDNTGLTTKWKDTINIDTTAPRFTKGTVLDKYVDRGDCVVFASKPSIKIESKDDGIGLKEIYLIDKEGNVVKNVNGLFELNASEYSLVLEDKLGNKTEPTLLKDVCNLPSNKIVIDTKKPIIDIDRAEGVYKDWFADDVDYSLNLKDDWGIKSITVSVNGKKVINDTVKNNNVTKLDYKFSTKEVKPNKDGSYNIVVSVVDIVGNTSNWNDTIYIDKSAPVIDKFIITGNGYLEGKDLNSSDKYGFYIKGKTNVEIHVSDGDYSSGVDTLYYDLVNADGSKASGKAKVVNGVAKVLINKDFKGYISAYAVDKVGNEGKSNRPDGIISESGNTHVNSSNIDINLPSTSHKDRKGNFLYNKDITISSSIVDDYSGLRKVKWGIGNETKGTVEIGNNGKLSGDTGSIVRKDKNLVLRLNKNLGVSENRNDLNIWVESEDRVGHVSKNNRVISIDKDAPVISVSYNDNNGDSFYNKTRVATVTIKERNFRSGDVKFSGTLGRIGKWTNIGDDTWTCNIEFSEDKDYQWSVGYTDMAGNTGKSYNSEKFTVDKTAPVLNLSFDNNNAENGNFYKNSRTATLTVKERNFNPSSVNLSGNGKLSGWSKNGDVYTASIVFDKDGKYSFSVDLLDKAGNRSNKVNSGDFIIDMTKPGLNILGVQNGVSYKKNTGFKVSFGDDNIDESRCSITLTGRSNGKVRLIGGINGKNGEFTFSGVPEDAKFDDLYTLKAVVYDKAGNKEEKEINYSLNRYGSKFAFLNKNMLNNIISESKDVILEETSVDRLDVKSFKVVVVKDGKEIPVDSKYIKVQELGGKDSNWLYRYTIDKEAFSSDGKYQVQVFSKALDGTKNSSLSQEYAFILDTTNPDIIVSGVDNGKSYNEVNKKVTVEVRDLSGVGSIKVLLNGKEVKLHEKEGIYTFNIDESTKKQNLVVEVTDKAGNVSVKEINDFLVTSNFVVSFVNSPIMRGLLATLGAGILFLLALLFKRRKDRKKEEEELAKEHAKMYHDSITGTSTNSSSDSTKDK